MNNKNKTTIVWVNYIKAFACILVVLGHFFQSMLKSGILCESEHILAFDRIIYSFHVYLFFVCSGYLYQKSKHIESLKDYVNNTKKRLIALGVPYVVFSGVTYLFKTVAGDTVNNRIEYSFFNCLFFHPLSPFWFLYALLICYLFVIPFRKTRRFIVYLGILAAAIAVGRRFDFTFTPIRYYLNYEIYFLAGMGLAILETRIVKRKTCFLIVAALLMLLFLLLMRWNLRNDSSAITDAEMGWLAIIGLCVMGISVENSLKQRTKWIQELFMPIYLMHTLFAAGLRILLFRMGVSNQAIHMGIGIIVSFLGPVLAYLLLKKTNYGLIIIYPYKVEWREKD